MIWPLLYRLRPFHRLLSTHTPAIPTSTPPYISPGTFGSLAHVPRKWELDPRGEPIKVAKGRRLGINISHRKLNLVAKLVRGLPIEEAYRQLAVCNKKSAPIVAATIATAVKNAQAFAFRKDRLVVDRAFVGKGCYLVRIRPWHGKGRYGVEHKKYAHLTIIVREFDDELWETKVMPHHFPISISSNSLDDDKHPIHKSDRVSWVSDMDKGLASLNQSIAGLKIALEEARESSKVQTASDSSQQNLDNSDTDHPVNKVVNESSQSETRQPTDEGTPKQ